LESCLEQMKVNPEGMKSLMMRRLRTPCEQGKIDIENAMCPQIAGDSRTNGPWAAVGRGRS
jgi:hypothetical protein